MSINNLEAFKASLPAEPVIVQVLTELEIQAKVKKCAKTKRAKLEQKLRSQQVIAKLQAREATRVWKDGQWKYQEANV